MRMQQRTVVAGCGPPGVGWGGAGAGAERGPGGWEGTQPVSAANRAHQAVRSLEPPPSAVIQVFCDLALLRQSRWRAAAIRTHPDHDPDAAAIREQNRVPCHVPLKTKLAYWEAKVKHPRRSA